MARTTRLEDLFPHPLDLALGRRVRNRRKAIRMKQGELADALGVSFQQLQKYERGLNRISFSRLVLIAKKLDLPTGELIEGLDGTAYGQKDLARDQWELVQAFAALPTEELKRTTLHLVKQLSSLKG